jgi:hypothetical protein
MLKSACCRKGCTRIKSEFSSFMNRQRVPRYDGNTFCSDTCLRSYFEDKLTKKWLWLQNRTENKIPRPKLGTIIMQTTFLTRDQLDEAVKLQNQAREGRLGEWLLRLGFVEERQITIALAKQYGLPFINLKNSNANENAVRMIPGKVAKSSSLVPVGFDDSQDTIRVAVSAPVDFNTQDAIRSMVHKGVLTYISDQSAIENLLESLYTPEELDLSSAPAYSSMDELIEVSREMVDLAVDQRAENIQAELLQEFFWVRLDFAAESHHHYFRHVSNPVPVRHPMLDNEMVVGFTGKY